MFNAGKIVEDHQRTLKNKTPPKRREDIKGLEITTLEENNENISCSMSPLNVQLTASKCRNVTSRKKINFLTKNSNAHKFQMTTILENSTTEITYEEFCQEETHIAHSSLVVSPLNENKSE